MHRCAGIKRDGGRGTVVVSPGETYCYQHDPERAAERRRNAARGGKSKGGGAEMREIKGQLKGLIGGVLTGRVDRSDAAVVNQILNTRLRLLELERKHRESEELEERLAALEARGQGGRRWGAWGDA